MFFRRSRQKPGLVWGVRESLTRYVAGLPDGLIATDGIADVYDDAGIPRFSFPFVEADPTEGEVRFAGSAEISGHGGLLRILVVEPRLRFRAGGAELSIGTSLEGSRAAVAWIPGVAAGGGWDDADSVLTAEGAEWLGPQYPAGAPAAPVTLRWSR